MKETTLIFFALCCLTVCQTAVCPFPGITAHAAFADGPISWVRRRSFREGNRVKYTCQGDSYSGHSVWSSMYWGEDDVLTCLPDGTWDRPLPQCGIILIHLRLNELNHLYLISRHQIVERCGDTRSRIRSRDSWQMVGHQQLFFQPNFRLLHSKVASWNGQKIPSGNHILLGSDDIP